MFACYFLSCEHEYFTDLNQLLVVGKIKECRLVEHRAWKDLKLFEFFIFWNFYSKYIVCEESDDS